MKAKGMLLALCAVVCFSCDLLGPSEDDEITGESCLRIAFASGPLTRSLSDLPDTSDFILTVSDAYGEVYYHGFYKDSPESIMVNPGSYTVKAVSEEFVKPAFSKPQYGDEQCVVVPEGGTADVRLSCRQINSGIRLMVDKSFLTGCPDGVLLLRSSEGSLMYGYKEKRIAYFNPGEVSLVLNGDDGDEILMTRLLKPQEILVLGVSVADGYGGGRPVRENISIALDTARNWVTEDCVIGDDGGKGQASSNALTVSQVMSSVGKEDVWVSGHIVGGDLTSSSASFKGPFSSRTCILLGPRSSADSRASCISVQLPSGEVRDALNLVDNPELLGRKILIKGDVTGSYYGLVGLKNCSDYKL